MRHRANATTPAHIFPYGRLIHNTAGVVDESLKKIIQFKAPFKLLPFQSGAVLIAI